MDGLSLALSLNHGDLRLDRCSSGPMTGQLASAMCSGQCSGRRRAALGAEKIRLR